MDSEKLISYDNLVLYNDLLCEIIDPIQTLLSNNMSNGFIQSRNLYTYGDISTEDWTIVKQSNLTTPIKSGEKITISYTSDVAVTIGFFFKDIDGNDLFCAYIRNDNENKRIQRTIDATDNVMSVGLYITNGCNITNIQIEKGTSATPYQKPYVSKSNVILDDEIHNTISQEWENKIYYDGDYCIYNNELWKCLITNSEKPKVGDSWEKLNIGEELKKINKNGVKFSVGTVVQGRDLLSPAFEKFCMIVAFRGTTEISIALKNNDELGTGIWKMYDGGLVTTLTDDGLVNIFTYNGYTTAVLFLYN